MKPVDPGAPDDFAIAAPAWRIRRLRAHLAAAGAAGSAARGGGESRDLPPEFEHRAERRRWLLGWDKAVPPRLPDDPKPPTARQLAKIARWQAGAGRLSPDQGALRVAILEAVAEEMLSARPLAHGAIVAALRETTLRCRAAGLPAPKASRYRKWLKLTGRAPAPAPRTGR